MRVLRNALLAGLVPGLLMLVVLPLVNGGRLFAALAFLGASGLGSLAAVFDRREGGMSERGQRTVATVGLLACLAWAPAAAQLAHATLLDPVAWFRLWPFLAVPMWLGLLVAADPRLSPLDLLAWCIYAAAVVALCWWSLDTPASWRLTGVYLAPMPVGMLLLRGVARRL